MHATLRCARECGPHLISVAENARAGENVLDLQGLSDELLRRLRWTRE